MSKGRRAPPSSPNATLKRRPFDPTRVAAEIVAALDRKSVV